MSISETTTPPIGSQDASPAANVGTNPIGGAASGAGGRKRYLLLSLLVLVLDQASKWLVEIRLPLHSSVTVIPGLLDFTHVRNTGVAFGLFAAHGDAAGTWILTGLGVAALVFVGYYFRLVPLVDRILLTALALVLGGAVGNLLDRIAQKAVTDFVDFYFGTYHWHTFNVADSAITIGITLMILASLRRAPDEPPESDRPSEGAASGS